MRANLKIFKEVRGDMCDALLELMQDELEEREQKGAQDKILDLINKKLAKGKSVEQIAEELEETPETIRELIEKL